jgi:SAM-dependent methyltransferase
MTRLVLDPPARFAKLRILDCIELLPDDVNRDAIEPMVDYTRRFLAPDEVRSFAKDPANDLPPKAVEGMLARGDECFGILDGAELAAYGWYSLKTARLDRDLQIRFEKGWVYMYSGFTKPAYRGQRLHALCLAGALEVYAEQGRPGLLSFAERRNLASLRSAYRLGFRRFGTVVTIGRKRRLKIFHLPGSRLHGYKVERARRRKSNRPRPTLAAVLASEREIMDDFAADYRSMTLSNPYVLREERRWFVEWLLERIRASGRDRLTLSYLDVGCGTGEILELLAEAGCTRLTGIDLSPNMLTEARQHASGDSRLLRGLVEDHPFRDHSFDVVIASFTVHHMLETAPFFDMVNDILRDEGWYFTIDHDADSLMLRRRSHHRIGRVTKPLRYLVEHKQPNAGVLRRLPDRPDRFNPGHRLRSLAEMENTRSPDIDYRLQHDAHGALYAVFLRLFVEESSLDRKLLRAIRRFEGMLPRPPKFFLWVAGQRRALAPGAETRTPRPRSFATARRTVEENSR